MRFALPLVLLTGCDLFFDVNPDPAADATSPGDAAAGACPAFSGERYLHVSTPRTWAAAHLDCKSLDVDPNDATYTHLVVLTDGIEAGVVVPATEDAWIGLRFLSIPAPGAWHWVTDEFPDDTNAPWEDGKPVDQASQSCANLENSTVQIDNSGCGAMKAYVCECDEFPTVVE
jgi:hypothetical protein